MPSHPILRIAWRNVRRHWRHSFGSLLSIVVGFIAIALFEGYLGDLRAIQAQWYSQRSMMGHVMIEKRGASQNLGREGTFDVALSREAQALIEAFLASRAGEVDARMRALALGGLASNGRAGLMFVGWAYDVQGAAAIRGPVGVERQRRRPAPGRARRTASSSATRSRGCSIASSPEGDSPLSERRAARSPSGVRSRAVSRASS